ncbi:variable large family protein (plasmid) [Borreliella americana]
MGESVANSVKADAASVKGIAIGIKGIVDAAAEGGVKLETAAVAVDDVSNKDAGKMFGSGGAAGADAAAEGGVKLEPAAAVDDDVSNKEAGKMFGTGGAGGAAAAADVAKAAAAVGVVSGEQILKAIAAAAAAADSGNHEGKKGGEAENAIQAAVGGDGKIGESATNGAKADAASVKGIAIGIKGIVDAAAEGGVKLETAAVADVDNKDAGKMFGAGVGAGANAGEVAKAAAAVGVVSGEQILKAIAAAAADSSNHDGKKGGDAENAIQAAIGGNNQQGENFADGKLGKKSDQIAAALVLRGMAKDGKFSVADAADAAAADVAKAAADGVGKIGESVANGAKADAASVKGIAIGIKGIVDAAAEGGVKLETAAVAVDDVSNKDAGKMFGTAGGADAAAGDVAKAAAAVGDGKIGESVANGVKADAESVKGIAIGIKGIVDAAAEGGVKLETAAVVDDVSNKDAGKMFGAGVGGDAAAGDVAKAAAAVGGGKHDGKKGGDAENAIQAAIGGNQQGGEAFVDGKLGKKSDQIAAALVLRGMAKDGKFSVANAAKKTAKSTVEAAVDDDSSKHDGKKGSDAENAIQAAIGGNQQGGEDFNDGKLGKKSDQIAAALVLRGMAKDGKFSVTAGDAEKTAKSTVEAAANGAKADAESVKGIAIGIKGIVDAAAEGGVKLEPVAAAVDDDVSNKEAGKMFGAGVGAGANAGEVAKAAAAVGVVSGEQILKAIADAAGDSSNHDGKKGNQAENAIRAAIGGDNQGGEDFDDNKLGKKSDQIAAALVLRGMAKDGKFSVADAGAQKTAKSTVEAAVDDDSSNHDGKKGDDAENAIQAAIGDGQGEAFNDGKLGKKSDQIAAALVLRGMAKDGKFSVANAAGAKKTAKSTVEAAAEGGVKLEPAVAVDVDNKEAGKMFGTAGGGAAAAAVAKAAAAVGVVSGEQILKAIADAAGDSSKHEGKKGGDAENAIQAAIGGDNQGGEDFNDSKLGKKSDQIAAALVLRGMAKDGKFSVNADAAGAQKTAKSTVEAAANGAKADAASVKGIAIGIKGIVDAAAEGGVKLETAAVDNVDNKEAGKMFGTAAGDAADASEVAKAAAAIGGDNQGEAFDDNKLGKKSDQIAAALVLRGMAKDGKFSVNADAAGAQKTAKSTVEAAVDADSSKHDGKKGDEAENAIQAAIGGDGQGGEDFNDGKLGKKSDQIAAALVLRGMAKDGKFSVNAADAAAQKTAKSTVEAAANGAKADAESVKGIAIGIKGIVDAAAEGGVKLETAAVAVDNVSNKDAEKMFGTGGVGGGDAAAGDVAKAAAAVGVVSGEQILKAIAAAADSGKHDGKKGSQAENAIQAAIGGDQGGEAFADEKLGKKSDQIAAALVLRGMAKDGKFSVNAGAAKKTAKSTVEAAGDDDSSKHDGKKGDDAENAIQAAIGGDQGEAFDDGKLGKKSDQIAAALVLRGMAKDGKFSVNADDAAKKTAKSTVEAAAEGGVKLEPVAVAVDVDNKEAGKMFGTASGGANAAANDVAKAAAAVGVVSGEQILKAIAAAADSGKHEGKKGGDAENAIQAAIGGNHQGEAFNDDKLGKKSDQIAAALVLRGMAKDGKFSVNDAGDAKKTAKSTVEAAANGAKADAESVKGIAIGIKGIVDAAAEGGVKLETAAVDNVDNKDAGKMFGTAAGDAGAGDVAKAAAAVGVVSGEQILKAIAAAAADSSKHEGKKGDDAENAIQAAIGGDNQQGEAFDDDKLGKKSDQIAAALVLRGMAKDGKFSVTADDAQKTAKSTVEAAANGAKADAESVKGIAIGIKRIVDAAAEGGVKLEPVVVGDVSNKEAGKMFGTAAGDDADASEVAKAAAAIGGDNQGEAFNDEKLEKKSDQIAAALVLRGMAKDGKFSVTAGAAAKKTAKSTVDAAAEDGVKLKPAAVVGDDVSNKEAGKMFGTAGGAGAANAGEVAKAAAAVGVVSGEQILKAIAAAAGDSSNHEGKKGGDAENAIQAAIGGDNQQGENFADDKLGKKSDQIAAALVLRGMAKDGKFSVNDAAAKKTAKSTVEAAVEGGVNWRLLLLLM